MGWSGSGRQQRLCDGQFAAGQWGRIFLPSVLDDSGWAVPSCFGQHAQHWQYTMVLLWLEQYAGYWRSDSYDVWRERVKWFGPPSQTILGSVATPPPPLDNVTSTTSGKALYKRTVFFHPPVDNFEKPSYN